MRRRTRATYFICKINYRLYDFFHRAQCSLCQNECIISWKSLWSTMVVHERIRNLDINEVDINETLGVFFNSNLEYLPKMIYERENPKTFLILWIWFQVYLMSRIQFKVFVIKLHVIFVQYYIPLEMSLTFLCLSFLFSKE